MTKFITFQTVVQFRQEILDDGSLGPPQIVKKFVSEIRGKQATYVRTKKETEIKKKVATRDKAKDLFKMQVAEEERL